jgi:hypothetical protein
LAVRRQIKLTGLPRRVHENVGHYPHQARLWGVANGSAGVHRQLRAESHLRINVSPHRESEEARRV